MGDHENQDHYHQIIEKEDDQEEKGTTTDLRQYHQMGNKMVDRIVIMVGGREGGIVHLRNPDPLLQNDEDPRIGGNLIQQAGRTEETITTEGILGTDTIISTTGTAIADEMIGGRRVDINSKTVLPKKRRRQSDKRNWLLCNRMHLVWTLIVKNDSRH